MKYLILGLSLVVLSGCNLKSVLDERAAQAKADEDAKEKQPKPKPKPKPKVQPAKKGIIGQMTNEVVDLQQALAENPDLEEVEPDVKGDDPLSLYLSAYIDASAKLAIKSMTHEVRLYQAQHDRYPTYKEFMDMIKRNHIKFRKLRRYQMYAYDSKEGKMIILEDPALR